MKTYEKNGVTFEIYQGVFFCMEPVYLDIETANNHAEDPHELRTWVSSIQVKFNGEYHLFRTPEELVKFYMDLYHRFNLGGRGCKAPKRLITYIHNANYDLSYLIPYFMEYLPHEAYLEDEGFGGSQGVIESNNKILSYCQGPFEWRCSYRLSNMSLEKWSEEMNIEHKKKVGLYDYSKVIYQDTELTNDELKYDKYDILAMEECLDRQMDFHNDNLCTTPLTFTGYVRRELRNSCQTDEYYNNIFKATRLSGELYDCCKRSYAGGFTHANRFYKGRVIEAGKYYKYLEKEIFVNMIGHRDFTSHYPSQIRCRLFPIGKPRLIYSPTMPYQKTIESVLELYPEYSTLTVLYIKRAEIKDKHISMPFMQKSKCMHANGREIKNNEWKNLREDNGRIIYAEGDWVLCCDNLTLDILNKQYNLDYSIMYVWKMKNGPLPKEITRVVDKYYKAKAELKKKLSEAKAKWGKNDERTRSIQFEYNQAKIALNSIYGCLATNPLRVLYSINDEMEFRKELTYDNINTINEGLDNYYNGRNNFLPYQVGVWITAYARHELFEFIEAIGYDKVLYCDTDSAFYIKDDEVEAKIKALNDEKHKTAQYVVLDDGELVYYDYFDEEPDCEAIKFLHSKCYGVVTKGKLELTVAGVPSRTLVGIVDGKPKYITREDELMDGETDPVKALDKLREGTTFNTCSGTSAVYIGAEGYGSARKPTIIEVDGHKISTAGGCVIKVLESKEVRDPEYDFSTYEYLRGMQYNFDT